MFSFARAGYNDLPKNDVTLTSPSESMWLWPQLWPQLLQVQLLQWLHVLS